MKASHVFLLANILLGVTGHLAVTAEEFLSAVPVLNPPINTIKEKATSLTAIGCDGHETITCNSTWVYCIDSLCEAPVNGVSKCYCWIQAPSNSIAPGTASSGAPCYMNTVKNKTQPYGQNMCESMAKGALWSTFGGLSDDGKPGPIPSIGFKNSSYLSPPALEICKGASPWVYCWGAACLPDPADPTNRAICDCPYVSNPQGTEIATSIIECPYQQYDACAYLHNGGPHNQSNKAISLFTQQFQSWVGPAISSFVDYAVPTCMDFEQPKGYTVLDNLDSKGGDIRGKKKCGITQQACADICTGIKSCIGFVYSEINSPGNPQPAKSCCYPKSFLSIPMTPFPKMLVGATYKVNSKGKLPLL